MDRFSCGVVVMCFEFLFLFFSFCFCFLLFATFNQNGMVRWNNNNEQNNDDEERQAYNGEYTATTNKNSHFHTNIETTALPISVRCVREQALVFVRVCVRVDLQNILPAVWTTTVACTTAHHNTNFHEKWREQEIKAFNSAHLPTPNRGKRFGNRREKKNKTKFSTVWSQTAKICMALEYKQPTWKWREWNDLKKKQKL